MSNVEKTLQLIEHSLNKKCNGLECKVVKNNIDLRLENIQLKEQINLIIDKINQNFNSIFFKYEIDEIKNIYYKIKNTSELTGLDLRKECIKQYFNDKIKGDK